MAHLSAKAAARSVVCQQQQRRRRRRRWTARRTGTAMLVLTATVLLAAVPTPVQGFQYAVLTSTSCETLAYSITLDAWEYKAAAFLRTSLGDPDKPARFTQVEIDQFFSRKQLQSPFVTRWNRPLAQGGSYTLFFGLLDKSGKALRLPGSSSLDTVSVTLTIPPCDGATSSTRTSRTKSASRSTSRTTTSTSARTATITDTAAEGGASASSSGAVAKSSSGLPAATGTSAGPDGFDPNATTSPSKRAGVPTGALVGAVLGAIVATLLLLWLVRLGRKRVGRSIKNRNSQHRASYLGPAPRPLLTPSGQSGRYYHTPSPGTSIMPPPSKTAAFFSLFTGGRRRKRNSIIRGIPSTPGGSQSTFAPTMKQVSHDHHSGIASPFGSEHRRRFSGTITPILRRPEDGFPPVGTAEQVAARRLSRESVPRSVSVTGHSSAHAFHQGVGGVMAEAAQPQGRPASVVAVNYPYGSMLDGNDAYAYQGSPANAALVDASDLLPTSDSTLSQQMLEQASSPTSPSQGQSYPRPLLLSAQRPASRASSRSGQAGGRAHASAAATRPGSRTGSRPGSSGSGSSNQHQPFHHPHKMKPRGNNDWATPYTPGGAHATGHGTSLASGGRSRSSSSSSTGSGPAVITVAVQRGGLGLGLPPSESMSSYGSGSGSAGGSMSMSMSGPAGGGGGGGSATSGLIPLQLAGSASSHLAGSSFSKDVAGGGGGPEPAFSLFGTGSAPVPAAMASRGRSGAAAMASGANVAGVGSGGGGGGGGGGGTLRSRGSLSGPTPIRAAYLDSGGGSSGSGSGSGGGAGTSIWGGSLLASLTTNALPTSHNSSVENLSPSPVHGSFGSPHLSPIAPPAQAASLLGGGGLGHGHGAGTSFLPRSGTSTPARSHSVSPGPLTKTNGSASTTTTTGGAGAGGAFAPRKRPSFSNDPVAYMHATAGFARPPSRSNSLSSAGHGGLGGAGGGGGAPVEMDPSNPLFAALSVLDDI